MYQRPLENEMVRRLVSARCNSSELLGHFQNIHPNQFRTICYERDRPVEIFLKCIKNIAILISEDWKMYRERMSLFMQKDFGVTIFSERVAIHSVEIMSTWSRLFFIYLTILYYLNVNYLPGRDLVGRI